MEEFGVAWLGPAELAGMVAGADRVSGAVLCPAGLPRAEVLAVVKDLEQAAVHVHVPSGLQGIGSQRLRSVDIAHEPFLYMAPPDLSRWQMVVKRTTDVVLALLILLVTAPVLLSPRCSSRSRTVVRSSSARSASAGTAGLQDPQAPHHGARCRAAPRRRSCARNERAGPS